MLFQIGAIGFSVMPINAHEADLLMGSDYAEHPVMGAQKPSEFVGQADTHLLLHGRLLPHQFGLGAWAALQAMAVSGTPHMAIRGDGTVLGWMLIERLHERHTHLDVTGVGRWIEFDVEMKQSPVGASADAMISLLGSLVSGLGG